MARIKREKTFLKTGLTHKTDLVLYLMARFRRALSRIFEGRSLMDLSKLSLAFMSVIALNTYVPTALPAASAAEQQAQTIEVCEEKIGGKCYQVSKVLVHVKPEHVWNLLTDYENAPNIFPCLKKCKLVKDKGTTKLVEHTIKPSGVPSTFDYIIEVKETVNRLYEWHRVSGDFREVDGYWKLDPLNDGNSTMVTYASYVNGGIFLPAPLIKRQVRTDIPGVMSALKSHAETSRTIAGVNHNRAN